MVFFKTHPKNWDQQISIEAFISNHWLRYYRCLCDSRRTVRVVDRSGAPVSGTEQSACSVGPPTRSAHDRHAAKPTAGQASVLQIRGNTSWRCWAFWCTCFPHGQWQKKQLRTDWRWSLEALRIFRIRGHSFIHWPCCAAFYSVEVKTLARHDGAPGFESRFCNVFQHVSIRYSIWLFHQLHGFILPEGCDRESVLRWAPSHLAFRHT